jgi:leucyl/phenylalanyl-tRNA---protein transferase
LVVETIIGNFLDIVRFTRKKPRSSPCQAGGHAGKPRPEAIALDGIARKDQSFAMSRPREPIEITPDILLGAYSIGLFPMAESAKDKNLFWVDPEQRGIFPLDGLILSRSLTKTVRSDRFEVKVDEDFDAVIDSCAAAARGREKTWISARIKRLYRQLFDIGHVHTVECWAEGSLAGGLYGVHLGAAFFGESMFHRANDASKVALVHLAARLSKGGFRLLDTQFVTPHLASLGAIEVSKQAYRRRLADALAHEGNFWVWPKGMSVSGRCALAASGFNAAQSKTPNLGMGED